MRETFNTGISHPDVLLKARGYANDPADDRDREQKRRSKVGEGQPPARE